MLHKVLLPLVFILSYSSLTAQDLIAYTIPENISKDADAVVRYEDYSIELLDQEKMLLHYKTAITIFNKNADYLAQPTLGYDKHDYIKRVYMEFYNSFGKSIKKVKKRDFKDYAASTEYLFTDNRLIHYNYIPISYPYTVYYEYEKVSENTAFIPTWNPINSFAVGVIKSNYSLKYPADFTIQKSENNFLDYEISKTKSIGFYNYKITNVLPVKRETLSAHYTKVLPSVKFATNKFSLAGIRGTANTWQEFGKWVYDKLLVNRNNLPEATKAKIKKMVNGISDPIERAKIIYEYVQNKTRYINVAIGIGGWQPMKTEEVDRLGYGDCKALTFYTKSLLDIADVPSFYTLVYSDTDKINIEKRTVAQQGNHAFLCLPTQKDTIWLECTSQKLPFGYISTTTDDRDVLVITPEGGKIARTSTNASQNNLQETTATYAIKPNGSIEGTAKIISYGSQYRTHLGSYDGLSPRELETNMKENFDFINNLKFSNISVVNNKLDKRFEEEISFSAENYSLINSDGSMLLTLNALNRLQHVPKREKDRKTQFEIPRGYKDLDIYTITIAENYMIPELPKPIRIKNEFGTYDLTLENISDSSIRYKRSFILNKGVYDKDKYEAYRKFRKQIKKNEKLKILLKKL